MGGLLFVDRSRVRWEPRIWLGRGKARPWELGAVLRRDRFRRYLSLDEVDAFLLEVEALCHMVDDPDPVPQILRDPDDDYLVALASASGVDAMVSGDLDLHEAPGAPVEVLTPRQALTRLKR